LSKADMLPQGIETYTGEIPPGLLASLHRLPFKSDDVASEPIETMAPPHQFQQLILNCPQERLSLATVKYNAGDVLVKNGFWQDQRVLSNDDFNYCHLGLGIITEGYIAIYQHNRLVRRLGPGQCIGVFETAFLLETGSVRRLGTWDLVAESDVSLLCPGRNMLDAQTSGYARKFRKFVANLARQDLVPQPLTSLPLLDWVAARITSNLWSRTAIIVHADMSSGTAALSRHLAHLVCQENIFFVPASPMIPTPLRDEMVRSGISVYENIDLLWPKIIREAHDKQFDRLLILDTTGKIWPTIPFPELSQIHIAGAGCPPSQDDAAWLKNARSFHIINVPDSNDQTMATCLSYAGMIQAAGLSENDKGHGLRVISLDSDVQSKIFEAWLYGRKVESEYQMIERIAKKKSLQPSAQALWRNPYQNIDISHIESVEDAQKEIEKTKSYREALSSIQKFFDDSFDPYTPYYGVAQTNRALFTVCLVPDTTDANVKKFIEQSRVTSQTIAQLAQESYLTLQTPPSHNSSITSNPPLDIPGMSYPAIPVAVIVATEIHQDMKLLAGKLKTILTKLNAYTGTVDIKSTSLSLTLHNKPFDSRNVATKGRQQNVRDGAFAYMVGYNVHMAEGAEMLLSECKDIINNVVGYHYSIKGEEVRRGYYFDREWSGRLCPPVFPLGLFGFPSDNDGALIWEVKKKFFPPQSPLPCKWAICSPGAWIHQSVDFTCDPQQIDDLVMRAKNIPLNLSKPSKGKA
jgi:hypothetical protein